MVIVAIASASYCFFRGLVNEVTKLNKLVLECLMVFSAIIPPDLPA